MIIPIFIGDSEQAFVEMSQALNNQINNIYPLSETYYKAVIKGDIALMLIFIAVSILAFMLFSLAVGKVFKRINTVIMTGRYKANYKLGRLKNSSPLKAIYIKDLKRYFASPIYVMNTGFGVVMMVLGSIALPFINLNTIAGDMDISGSIKDLIPIFITLCIATSSTTMASISIEGKNIWILKNLPVSVSKIFASKILVNLTILTPALLSSIFISFIMELPFINGLLIMLSVVSFSVFVSLYGLVINLSFPNLSWTNETVIVKQSTASMISIFSGMGMTAIQYLLIMVLGNVISGMLLFIGLLWILNIILYGRLGNGGRRQFARLNG
jgi:ABC-2 type transport system permease protein